MVVECGWRGHCRYPPHRLRCRLSTEPELERSLTDPTTGAVTVNANCHDVPDWWQFQGVRHFLGRHKTATKVVMNAVVIPSTVVSGLADGGTSELLVPEEIALEEAILERGTAVEETAAEAAAEDAAETAAQPASEKQALRGFIM